MNNFGSFALPYGYDWSLSNLIKQVKTVKWAKCNAKHLIKYQDRLTNAKRDDRQILGGMLQAAFGANIGRQVEENLTDEDLAKIRLNIIFKI